MQILATNVAEVAYRHVPTVVQCPPVTTSLRGVISKITSSHCAQVDELEKSLSVEENSKKISDLETELEIASSEVMRLQKALEEMEEWKEKLVKESK